MAGSSFGELFRFTTWGESHGPAIGCVVDGVPSRLPLGEADIQVWLDKRRPGQSKFTTQRQEPDQVEILSGVFDGLTTGTPVQLLIRNQDQRSRDYGDIQDKYRPGHADYAAMLRDGQIGEAAAGLRRGEIAEPGRLWPGEIAEPRALRRRKIAEAAEAS